MATFHNSIFWICILSCFIAQLLKIVFNYLHTKNINMKLLISSGGMPSSHSAFVSSLATSVGLLEGFDSNLFAICLVLSCIVMYDASGVRRAAGQQAAVINIIVKNLENFGLKIDSQLKELLGHSPIEVISGAMLGIIIALIVIL